MLRAKYQPDLLRAALTSVFGDRVCGDSTKAPGGHVLQPGRRRLLAVPHGGPFAPAPGLAGTRGRRGDGDLGRADHLPGVPLAGTRLIDGGIWANNPAMVAVVEPVGTCATRLEDPRVFSLGTTIEVRHRSRRLDQGGLLPSARAAVDVILRAQSISANNHVYHLLSSDRPVRGELLVLVDRTHAAGIVGSTITGTAIWVSHGLLKRHITRTADRQTETLRTDDVSCLIDHEASRRP